MTIRLSSEKTFFTSDTHLFHHNIIAACKRPFVNTDDMRAVIRTRWNALIPWNGVVFHLGDLSLGPHNLTAEYLATLNGHKILIRGNHDKQLSTAVRNQFDSIHDLLEIDVQEPGGTLTRITLCHYALRTWNRHHFGAWQLHGHSHGNLAPIGRQMDVGVDTNNYTPYTFEQIKQRLSAIPTHQVDHHVAN